MLGSLDLGDVADGVEELVRTACADPAGTVQTLLEENPVWSRVDALNAVKNRQMLDVVRVAQLLRTSRWDLQALVRECPVPVLLLAATQDTAITEPDRAALMSRLPAEHIAVIESGHNIHRERPALWLHYVLRFAQADLIRSPLVSLGLPAVGGRDARSGMASKTGHGRPRRRGHGLPRHAPEAAVCQSGLTTPRLLLRQ